MEEVYIASAIKAMVLWFRRWIAEEVVDICEATRLSQ